MKTNQNILIAFLLNLAFAVLEFFGGVICGSSAIMSDSVHDLGDAVSIGASFFLEKKSEKGSDEDYTFGYARFSILGSIITTLVLTVGSLFVIYNAIKRLIYPIQVHYNEMILFAIVGVAVNTIAALITQKGESYNQKAVNLHMLEDVLGWLVVLVGAVVMRFSNINAIDPIMSIAVSLLIIFNALKTLKASLSIMLEKSPENVDVNKLKNDLKIVDGVVEIKNLRIWRLDEQNTLAMVQIVVKNEKVELKPKIKTIFEKYGVIQSTVELCGTNEIITEHDLCHNHSHHHHHHH